MAESPGPEPQALTCALKAGNMLPLWRSGLFQIMPVALEGGSCGCKFSTIALLIFHEFVSLFQFRLCLNLSTQKLLQIGTPKLIGTSVLPGQCHGAVVPGALTHISNPLWTFPSLRYLSSLQQPEFILPLPPFTKVLYL